MVLGEKIYGNNAGEGATFAVHFLGKVFDELAPLVSSVTFFLLVSFLFFFTHYSPKYTIFVIFSIIKHIIRLVSIFFSIPV